MHFRGRTWPFLQILMVFLLAASPAQAEQDYIPLRSGPSEAFPVIAEITPDLKVRAIKRRGSWFLLTDERKQGWLHADQLYRITSLGSDQQSLLMNISRPGKTRLEAGFSSENEVFAGVSAFFRDYRLYGRYTHASTGSSGWSLAEAGLIRTFARMGDSFSFNWSAGLGAGQDEDGNRHWHTEKDTIVPVASVSADAVWHAEQRFEIGVRTSWQLAITEERQNYPAVSLFWNLRL
ncbi:MAG TPA: hypothetical protein DEA26_04600 [Oceanospirillales bacterium]|nr:hypothetical protein [Oceanospirillaceae bacterium]HBS41938.1 hypothetical protein [Oceanospirillales bacterium]